MSENPFRRGPGLAPSPSADDPAYPSMVDYIVQITELHGCVEKLEVDLSAAVARAERAEVERDAAIARADEEAGYHKAAKKLLRVKEGMYRETRDQLDAERAARIRAEAERDRARAWIRALPPLPWIDMGPLRLAMADDPPEGGEG